MSDKPQIVATEWTVGNVLPAVASAPPASRLVELAEEGARRNHSAYHGWRGHQSEFDACPHEDCRLVRDAAAPSGMADPARSLSGLSDGNVSPQPSTDSKEAERCLAYPDGKHWYGHRQVSSVADASSVAVGWRCNCGQFRADPAAPSAYGELHEDRCAFCGWPLVENVTDGGCVRGNCSMRPLPARFYDPARANREVGVDVSAWQTDPYPNATEAKIVKLEAALLAQEQATRRAEQERDETKALARAWCEKFNRSEQFQVGPTKRAEAAESQIQGLREERDADRQSVVEQVALLDAIIKSHTAANDALRLALEEIERLQTTHRADAIALADFWIPRYHEEKAARRVLQRDAAAILDRERDTNTAFNALTDTHCDLVAGLWTLVDDLRAKAEQNAHGVADTGFWAGLARGQRAAATAIVERLPPLATGAPAQTEPETPR